MKGRGFLIFLLIIKIAEIGALEQIKFPKEMFQSSLSSFYLDYDDVWLGSRGGDILRYSLSEKEWKIIKQGQPSLSIKSVNQIVPVKNFLFFISYNGIEIYNRRDESFSSLGITPQEHKGFLSAIKWRDGLILGSQNLAPLWFNLDSFTAVDLPIDISNVSFISNLYGEIFLGSDKDGLYRLNRDISLSPIFPTKTKRVRALFKLNNSYLCGSYGGGLYLLNEEKNKIEILLSPLWITGGAEGRHFILFSTLDRGVLVYNKHTRAIKFMGIEEGLLSMSFNGVLYKKPYFILAPQDKGLLLIDETEL